MKIRLWKRMKKTAAAAVQTARGRPMADVMQPPHWREWAVYDGLRQSIPVIDAAIGKIGRLVGGCAPICTDQQVQAELEAFFRDVRVGAAAHGMDAFIRCYLDSLLTYGNAVGEIVAAADGRSVAGLYNAPLSDVCIRQGTSPLEAKIYVYRDGVTPTPAPYPELLLFSALEPPPGQVYGCSLLRGLPFVSDILMKIYASIGQNFERMGNLRYAVTYRPGPDAPDQTGAKEIADSIAREWADATDAARHGVIRDFVAVGDVDIKVIGADSQMVSTEVPVRQMLEQIIAKLGVPPFLLGLNWSTTERMSAQQADILTSELESYRRLLTPVLVKICTIFLRLRGYVCGVDIVWENINLQDELELANARLTNLQADQLQAQLENGQEG